MSGKENKNLDLFMEEIKAEKTVAAKFEKAGITPFPEVSREEAAKILKCREAELRFAILSAELRARRVGQTHFIKIIDLWQFGINRELKKLKK